MVVVRSMHDVELMPAGSTALQLRQRRVDAVDGVDDVRAGLAEDDDQHRRLAVDQPGGAEFSTESLTSATSESRTAAPL